MRGWWDWSIPTKNLNIFYQKTDEKCLILGIFLPSCFLKDQAICLKAQWSKKSKILLHALTVVLVHSRLICLGGVPVLWSKWPLASSLLQAIKTCRQACPPGYLMHFSWGWIPESLVNNNAKLTKLLKVWWKHVLFILFRRSNFQQTLNNFVDFELLFIKLSGIHSYVKCIK